MRRQLSANVCSGWLRKQEHSFATGNAVPSTVQPAPVEPVGAVVSGRTQMVWGPGVPYKKSDGTVNRRTGVPQVPLYYGIPAVLSAERRKPHAQSTGITFRVRWGEARSVVEKVEGLEAPV